MAASSGDAKNGEKPKGFVPGGASLHSPMTPHGPDAGCVAKAEKVDLKPHFFDGGLAFMFETCHTVKLTPWALDGEHRDREYYKCWSSLPRKFDPTRRGASDADNLVAWRAEAKVHA